MPGIGNAIGIPFKKGAGISWSSYWATRFPSALTVTTISDNIVLLSWTNNGTADYTGHKIYISTDGTNFTLNKTVASIGTSTYVTELSGGVLYWFYVKAYKSTSESTSSGTVRNFAYRKRIPITGAAGAGTNYQVRVEVNSGAGADADGVVYLNSHSLNFPYDIMFTSTNGVTALPFYIDRILGGTTQKYIWVRPTEDLSSGTKYIYIYYGKAVGSLLSNGVTTFNFFESFDLYKNTEAVENFTTLAELQAVIEPNKYCGNPIISHGTGWKDSQVHFPQVLVDPTDSTKLIMFLGGMAAPVQNGIMSIGRYTGTVANPYSWVEYGSNPILQRGLIGDWDGGHVIGPDTVFWNTDDSKFWMYYTGRNAGGTVDGIGLATSSDGITWTKHASNPILTADGNGRDDGDHVSTCSVLRDGANWYMYYSYRNGATVLPGIRIASSADGVTWTKQEAGDILSVGAWYDTTYFEGCQVIKLGSKYVMFYDCYDGTNWRTALASSDSWNTGWTKDSLNPIFAGSFVDGDWDDTHESTFRVFNINSKWYVYYQGCGASPYGTQNWDLGVATFDLTHYKRRGVGAINGVNGWTSDAAGLISATLWRDGGQGVLATTPAAACTIDQPSIASGNTFRAFSAYIRVTATTGNSILFYIFEGATMITAINILSNNLVHYISGGTQNIQAASANTWYKITIAFSSKTAHHIYINDVLQGALATTNATNITTDINRIVLQRLVVAAGTSYWDAITIREYLASPPVVETAEAEEAV